MEPLHRRLGTPLSYGSGFAHHVTHGVRLRSIAKRGLVAGLLGVQHDSKGNWFSIGPAKVSTYGTDVVQSVTRRHLFARFFAGGGGYFQGVAVLRASEAYLRCKLGYNPGTEDSLTGTVVVPPDALEVYIDDKWQALSEAVLPKIYMRRLWFHWTYRRATR